MCVVVALYHSNHRNHNCHLQRHHGWAQGNEMVSCCVVWCDVATPYASETCRVIAYGVVSRLVCTVQYGVVSRLVLYRIVWWCPVFVLYRTVWCGVSSLSCTAQYGVMVLSRLMPCLVLSRRWFVSHHGMRRETRYHTAAWHKTRLLTNTTSTA